METICIMECPVCLSGYNSDTARPLFLSCGHTFCSSCISQLVQGYGTLVCPACQTTIQDAATLPTNFSLLDSCSRTSAELEDTTEVSGCSLHPDKKVKFHCVNCTLDFCSRCVTLHSGDNHRIEDLNLSVDRDLDALLRKASDLESKLEEGQNILEQLRRRGEEVEEVRKSLEKAYDEALVQLQTERAASLAFIAQLSVSNTTSLSTAQVKISQLSSQLSQAQALLRPARHSASSPSLKRASLVQADALLRDFSSEQCHVDCRIEVGRLEIKPMTSGVLLSSEPVEIYPQLKEEKRVEVKGKVRGKKYDPVWWYMNDSNNWSPYAPGLSRQIELAYQSKDTAVDLGRHTVDFTRLVEVNKKTGKQRKVGREIS